MGARPADPREEALRHQVKGELRTRMRGVRKVVPAAARAARSARITARVEALPEWVSARTILVFLSMPTEVDTEALIASAWASGRRVAAPRLTERGLEVRLFVEGAERIRSGGLQLEEPAATAPEVPLSEVDLVLVPALALDPRGARIGYGAGYYDHLLPRLERAFRVGVAFDFQLIAEVPETANDVRVHAVVTDARTLDVGDDGGTPVEPAPAERSG
jgi:5-formyltetrahydrofolate cyclo-ligase